MGIRERFMAARESAGPNFQDENPGVHFFFDDQGGRMCLFCRRTEVWAKENAPDGQEYVDCPGE